MTTKLRRTGVLLPVLIQDPAVAEEEITRRVVHPVIVRDPTGFTDGPTCRRVAIVDLDFRTGELRAPALLDRDRQSTPYRDISVYDVMLPTKKGVITEAWSRTRSKGKREGDVNVSELDMLALDDPFLKVSVFGAVLRTLGMVQDPAVLGREVKWAFPGEQLLVVPRAGELDNAFYHRDSRSLQFYFGERGKGRTVYSGLSQDIVAHETAHALIDGIAPDLYDSFCPESLAIHEGIADLTAAMVSMRNRERLGRDKLDEKVYLESSRYSRIAEEFGRWRGHGDSLRDVCNTKSLRPRASAPDQVDTSSPHATSEVLSGLLFDVFRALFAGAPKIRAVAKKIESLAQSPQEGLRYHLGYACNATLGLAYRGLDWLPPGDASFADLASAMIAADVACCPDRPHARDALRAKAKRRGIPIAKPAAFAKRVALPRDAAGRRAFVERYRSKLGIPADARVEITIRTLHIYEPPLMPKSTSESFDLTPNMKRLTSAKTEHRIIKLRWWQREANDLGDDWGRLRGYRTGATIVTTKGGVVLALLQNRHAAAARAGRSQFLRRMIAAGERAAPVIGPDGVELQCGLRARLTDDTLTISGALQALHVAGER